MKVGELIKKLEKLDKDKNIYYYGYWEYRSFAYNIEEVNIIKNTNYIENDDMENKLNENDYVIL